MTAGAPIAVMAVTPSRVRPDDDRGEIGRTALERVARLGDRRWVIMTLPPRQPLPPSAPEQLLALHWEHLRVRGVEDSIWPVIEAVEALHHLYVVEARRRRRPHVRDVTAVATVAQSFERLGPEGATPVLRAEARRVAGLLDDIVSSLTPEERRRAGAGIYLTAIDRLRTWAG